MESIYEYGSRVGVWRILREFEQRACRSRCSAWSMALERYPELLAAFVERGHEIASHGCAGSTTRTCHEATEREHMRRGTATC